MSNAPSFLLGYEPVFTCSFDDKIEAVKLALRIEWNNLRQASAEHEVRNTTAEEQKSKLDKVDDGLPASKELTSQAKLLSHLELYDKLYLGWLEKNDVVLDICSNLSETIESELHARRIFADEGPHDHQLNVAFHIGFVLSLIHPLTSGLSELDDAYYPLVEDYIILGSLDEQIDELQQAIKTQRHELRQLRAEHEENMANGSARHRAFSREYNTFRHWWALHYCRELMLDFCNDLTESIESHLRDARLILGHDELLDEELDLAFQLGFDFGSVRHSTLRLQSSCNIEKQHTPLAKELPHDVAVVIRGNMLHMNRHLQLLTMTIEDCKKAEELSAFLNSPNTLSKTPHTAFSST